MERSFRAGGHGRWWDKPEVAQQVGITDDQKKKMDDIFQQHKLQLIDLKATLEKQETVLQPLIEADQPDETKILAQIDAIAQARAELEKANARMLFGHPHGARPRTSGKKLRSMAQQGPPRGDRSDGQRKWGSRPGGQSGPDGAPPRRPRSRTNSLSSQTEREE